MLKKLIPNFSKLTSHTVKKFGAGMIDDDSQDLKFNDPKDKDRLEDWKRKEMGRYNNKLQRNKTDYFGKPKK